jgi:hypothetical protein
VFRTTTTWYVHSSKSFKRVQIYELAIQFTSLNAPSEEKTLLIFRLLLISMSRVLRIAPNVTLRLGPPPIKIIIPSVKKPAALTLDAR